MKIIISLFVILIVITTSCGTYSNRKMRFHRADVSTPKTTVANNKNNSSEINKDVPDFPIKQNLAKIEASNIEILASANESTSIDPSIQTLTSSAPTNLISRVNPKKNNDDVIKPGSDEEFAKKSALFGGLSFIPVVGWVFSILAVIFGSIALSNIKKNPEKYGGKKKATIGIILGIVSLIIGITITIILLATMF